MLEITEYSAELVKEKTDGGELMSRVGTYSKPRVPGNVGYKPC